MEIITTQNSKVEEILSKLPADINLLIKNRIKDLYEINEIRISLEKPLIVLGKNEYIFYNCIITNYYLDNIIKNLTENSLYTYERELIKGYFTIKGGHRIGISGKFTETNKKIISFNHISGLNIRIAKDISNISDKIIPFIINNNNKIKNILIVSPPGCGKTTLLRDLIRNLSNGRNDFGFKGFYVAVIDERSEIAAIDKENKGNDLGIRTYIIDGVSKYNGILMAIRSLSPEIIAVDELGDEEDYIAINEAAKMGVKVIATVHSDGLDELFKRKLMKQIFDTSTFEIVVLLSKKNGPGTIEKIINLGEKHD